MSPLLTLAILLLPLALSSGTTPPIPTAAPCLRDSGPFEFWCVRHQVPLDHFRPSDPRLLSVHFLVLPAAVPSRRRGALVFALGGPGTVAHQDAQWLAGTLPVSVLESFDVVLFDQRGVGWSCGLYCRDAEVALGQGEISAGSAESAVRTMGVLENFTRSCVGELARGSVSAESRCEISGMEGTGLQGRLETVLGFAGTEQAAEDLDSFMTELLGGNESGRFWMYGKSYGTQFAQQYAMKHAARLEGLVLDCAVDMNLTLAENSAEVVRALAEDTRRIEEWCEGVPDCRHDLCPHGSGCVGSFLRLVTSLQAKEGMQAAIRFPLPGGAGWASRQLSVSGLELAAQNLLYVSSDRVGFLRALASAVSRSDLVPFLRWLYVVIGIDPITQQVAETSPREVDFSDASYYGINCADYIIDVAGLPNSTNHECAQRYLNETSCVRSLPFSTIGTADLTCAYWKRTSRLQDMRPPPLAAEGVPTLVLSGELDPATPHLQSHRVWSRLADGYLVSQQGGGHPVYLHGSFCVDAIVNDFLLSGRVPTSRETVCPGDVVPPQYVPLPRTSPEGYSSIHEVVAMIDTELHSMPEFLWWWTDWPGASIQVGCPSGGHLKVVVVSANLFRWSLFSCAITPKIEASGNATEDLVADKFSAEFALVGRWRARVGYCRNLTGSFLAIEAEDSARATSHAEVWRSVVLVSLVAACSVLLATASLFAVMACRRRMVPRSYSPAPLIINPKKIEEEDIDPPPHGTPPVRERSH